MSLPSGVSPSVLVVDDVPSNLMALGAVLKPLNVRVIEAHTGAEALARVSEESFAVVLLDVQMPEMDGFEVARRLRSTEHGHEVPIIFLTAIHRDEAFARKGYASGAADYMTKPFDADVLRARVKGFVELFRQREKLRVEEVAARTRERDDALVRLASLLESERLARREAEIASQAKDQFLATVSHELRTPLNAILGWTVLARRQAAGSELDRALAIVERNARAQMRIIEDVLDVSRIISGKLRLEISTANVFEVVQGAVQGVRPAAEAKELRLETHVDPGVGLIAGDADRLQQIVWNLLSNAIKFTPRGGRVEVSASRQQSDIVIRVSDTGQGIDPEFLSCLFEPFRQADGSTTRCHGGLGLGLSIAKQLVHAHGGKIVAQSEGQGRGASFTVELPARAVPALAGARTRAAQPIAVPSAGACVRLDGLRVLVVDDEEDARSLLAVVVGEQGADVSCACSGEEALRLVSEVLPDVVVSDIGMPEMDGYMLIREIRSLPAERGGRTPAIALTAYARPEDSEQAFAAGFQSHAPKPVDATRLVSLIANLGGISLGSVIPPDISARSSSEPPAGRT